MGVTAYDLTNQTVKCEAWNGDAPSAPEGAVVVTDGSKNFEIRVGGVRFEHVAQDAKGRWIYAKSV